MYANLADVDYIGLSLFRDMPSAGNTNPSVQARVVLFDASLDANGGLRQLAVADFGQVSGTYRGNVTNGFSSPFNFASWLDPEPVVANTRVPEPGSTALVLVALLGLALSKRRTRACQLVSPSAV